MITEKLNKTIRKYGLINSGDFIIIGLSGGPDSVALLYLLKSLSVSAGLKLHAAHLDHMLRKDSHKDAEFVKNLCIKLKIPVTIGKLDVKLFSPKGSVEQNARNARLNFLLGLAKKINADKIALGHNLDDQAETVLMRILRGSGLYGLCGIAPKREIRGASVIRPLIDISRREIETYLKKRKIGFMVDKTNFEDIYMRNRIRHELIPFLQKKYNNNIKILLSGMAESVSYDYDYLRKAAEDFINKQPKLSFCINKFKKIHPAIQNLSIRIAIEDLKGDIRRIESRHIREIRDMIINRPTGSIVDLPCNLQAVKKKKTILFCQKKSINT